MESRKQILEKIMASMGELHSCLATSRDSFLAQFDLSRPQMELLFSIKHEARTTGEIAKLFGITSSAVSQMVDQLERKKLIERSRDPKDRRITHIHLSPEARRTFNSVRDQFIKHLDARFVNINNDELQTLLQILTKTIKHLEKEPAWKK